MPMIAALLTIVGYSINDTIVIFDRIRENLSDQKRLGTRESFPELVNRALNQTFSRTILTSGVTLLTVVAMFLVTRGTGSALEGFSFALIVGMISGTYSTVFIATPVLLWLKGREEEAGGTTPSQGGTAPVTPAAADPQVV
jgi:preprotein translocase subunit SecF